jgi:hypothetical protein
MATWWSSHRYGRRRRTSPAFDEEAALAPGDLAELDDLFAAVEAEQSGARDARVALQLSTLVDRGVPVRAVEVAPGLQAIRLRFADGTVVLVRGWVPGDAGLLARWVRACSVVPVACSVGARGTQLEFSVEGQPNRLALRVTGLDQPG